MTAFLHLLYCPAGIDAPPAGSPHQTDWRNAKAHFGVLLADSGVSGAVGLQDHFSTSHSCNRFPSRGLTRLYPCRHSETVAN